MTAQRITTRTTKASLGQFRTGVYVDGELYAAVYGKTREQCKAEAAIYVARVRLEEGGAW